MSPDEAACDDCVQALCAALVHDLAAGVAAIERAIIPADDPNVALRRVAERTRRLAELASDIELLAGREPRLLHANAGTMIADVVDALAKQPRFDPLTFCHSGDADLLADREAVTRAIYHLAQNAADAVTPLGPHGHVQVLITADDNHVVVTITDNAPAIPQDELDAITSQPFHSTKRSCGRGRGLAVARAVARMHGGTLELTSIPGSGTSAALELARQPE